MPHLLKAVQLSNQRLFRRTSLMLARIKKREVRKAKSQEKKITAFKKRQKARMRLMRGLKRKTKMSRKLYR